jgi:hypothetical protein
MRVGVCSRIVDNLFTSRQTLIHRVPKHPPIKIHGVVATQHNTLNPQHTHNRKLGGYHSWSAPVDEAKKKILPFLEIEPWFVWRTSHGLATALTELSQLPLLIPSNIIWIFSSHFIFAHLIIVLIYCNLVLTRWSFYTSGLEFKGILQSSGTGTLSAPS